MMTIAVWKTEYLTGHSQVDQEHQQLFCLVNDLHEAMLNASDTAILRALVGQMSSHTIAHFQSEERLMRAEQYPGFDRHKQSHDALLSKIHALVQQLDQQEGSPTVRLTEFLTEWLAHHIKGEDQKMIRYFQQQADLYSVRSLSGANL